MRAALRAWSDGGGTLAAMAQAATERGTAVRYRFGVFELDRVTGELRRKGMRVRLHAQPFEVLCLLLERPGEMLTREEICRVLWPEGTFVDYEHGVNSAVNRLREALGDKASNPQFVETLARRGYRFVAPVERWEDADLVARPAVSAQPAAVAGEGGGLLGSVLATPADLPGTSPALARTLYLLLQLMYVGFYVGALANLAEIADLFSALPHSGAAELVVKVTAAVLIPVRAFLVCAVLFKAPGLRGKLLRLWPYLLLCDVLWALAPFLLMHHMSEGLALACMTLLVYSPFAQRSLVLMGAGDEDRL